MNIMLVLGPTQENLKLSPFDIINHICTSSENNWADMNDKDYNSFMINRGLSYYGDCVLVANEMNQRYHLGKAEQYAFYLNAISPKKKRWSKWSSSKKDKDIDLISEYYSVTPLKAQGIRQLLSDNDLKDIESILSKGGT